MATNDGSTSRFEVVNLSYRLAEETKKGWDNKEVATIISEICQFTDQDPKAARLFLQANANDAVTRLKSSSPRVAHIAKYITTAEPEKMIDSNTIDAANSTIEEMEETPKFLESDPALQLNIMKELMQIPNQKNLDINLVFQMTLEGLHRGVGMDRSLMAIITPQRDVL